MEMGPGGPTTRKVRAPLALKLAVCLVIGTAGFFAFAGYLNLNMQRRNYERLVLASADRVSDIIQRSTRYQMLLNNREGVYHLIRDVGSEPGIRRVRIFNKEGLISYSTEPGEVGRLVDKRAEECYACHAQEQPLTKLDRPDRARIFKDPGGERILAVIQPIENQPDCSNAACHAHPESKRILGVIDAQLSLRAVDEQMAGHQTQITTLTALAVLLFSALSAVFIWGVVHRPIKELMAGTKKVAGGELDLRLPVRSHDELGALAQSFNKMTSELEQAHAELTEWARTLEDRVRIKGEALERAHSSLVASEKMASLGKLAATVAHEVNNPLFGMLTYARLTIKTLQAGDIDPKARAAMIENLKIIERESLRCGEIMKNLLTFARQQRPHRAPTDLNTLVDRAVKLVRHKLEMQDIDLEVTLDPAIPEIRCDSGQIQQVILVLTVNAAEAMPQGGRLTMATACDTTKRTAEVRVRDTGSGIPPEALNKIFEPFFTTKEDQHRTGLGLAIAKNIVEQHAGSLAVESQPGKGTEFVLTLPFDVPEPDTPALSAAGGSGNSEKEEA
ncbi:MAG TPA: ATP-binding protein [Bryobacteraceae bacterium]|nr:ATP-binding protein [Bryobacteraceae bacterium]